MTSRLSFTTVIILTVLSLISSCRHKSAEAISGGDTITTQARMLTLIDKDGYTIADVRNPWGDDTTALLKRYILAPHDYQGQLPEGTVVRVPLRSSLVYSGVYAGAIDELGAAQAIAGVADGQYFNTPSVVEGLRTGRITDVGNSMSPSIERIVSVSPEAIILSPYQGMQAGAIEKLGIPIIQFVDYMESTPLGRAEWIRLLGILYGNRAGADSTFEAVTESYDSLCKSLAHYSDRPIVITEQPLTGGSWDVPAGESYMARMLADAGAIYPWHDTKGAGSLKIDAPAVLNRAADADFWLIRSLGPMTLQSLGAGNPLTSQFKAFRNGNVYVCDTSVVPLFDEFPFHPERLLADFIAIFHPAAGSTLRYYRKL